MVRIQVSTVDGTTSAHKDVLWLSMVVSVTASPEESVYQSSVENRFAGYLVRKT